MKKIIEAVPNFSEGRNQETIEAIADEIRSVTKVKLLGYEADPSHNRSVFTLAGGAEAVGEAAFRGVAEAVRRIDLNQHEGEHPRMGACDVLPFIPLPGVEMGECIALAERVGERIGKELEVPVYLYEEAARREDRKNLAKIRKPRFEGLKELIGTDADRDPDFGPRQIHPTAGATAVGARFFLIAYNVNLQTEDVDLAKSIAKSIRERDGGFPKVKAMGFSLEDRKLAQVSMNLTNFTVTPILTVFEAIKEKAAAQGVEVVESEIVGLAPQAALPEGVAETIQLTGFDPTTQIIEQKLAAS